MKVYLKVIEDEKTQAYDYEYLLETLSETKRQHLFKTWHHEKKRIQLVCTCNAQETIRMTVAHYSKSDKYTLRTYPEQKERHLEHCCFYGGTYSPSADYEAGWREQENGLIHVQLSSWGMRKSVNRDHASPLPSPPARFFDESLHEGSKAKGRLSIFEFSRKLLIKSWDDYIYFRGKAKYPELKDIYERLVKYTIKKVHINGNIPLDQLMYYKGKVGRIYYIESEFGFKYLPFFLLQYHRHDTMDEHTMRLELLNPLSDEEVLFEVDRHVLESCMEKTRMEGPFMVGGFVKSGKYGRAPMVQQMALIPINEHGVVVESSYERQFYNKVCAEKRLVQRLLDTKFHPRWNGVHPDGLFIDTHPRTVVEIFGMSEHVASYHEERRLKINHFSQLRPHYAFWYWNAYKGEAMPPFPTVRKYRKQD
jgi:hypothetical protein